MCERQRACLYPSWSASISLYSIKYPCEMIKCMPVVNAVPAPYHCHVPLPQVARECFTLFSLHSNDNDRKKKGKPMHKREIACRFCLHTAMHSPHSSFAFVFILRNLWNSNNRRATIKAEKQKRQRGKARDRETIDNILNFHNYIHKFLTCFFFTSCGSTAVCTAWNVQMPLKYIITLLHWFFYRLHFEYSTVLALFYWSCMNVCVCVCAVICGGDEWYEWMNEHPTESIHR